MWGVNDRWKAMIATEGTDSFVNEIDYVYIEMRQRGNWSSLTKTATMSDAMSIVVDKFEQAGYRNFTCRVNSAVNILNAQWGVPGAKC